MGLKKLKLKLKEYYPILSMLCQFNKPENYCFQIIAPLKLISIAASGIITLNNMKLPIFDNFGPIKMAILCGSL